ncbi:VOC family protein [Aestuariivirga sp.]|uniref:VOC family protein n=1 Tax=Aestuariivirga sp. TaxID=2650926 RepID=UPI0039E34706
MVSIQKIRPCLWFEGNAEEAVNHYLGAFPDSKITHVARYGKEAPGRDGIVLLIEFELAGQQFMALNGGPAQFKPNESLSLAVNCEDQAEVDRVWDHLVKGGRPVECGWLVDAYGYRWQVIPRRMMEMMREGTPAQRSRAMSAMMKMVKFDIAALEKAYAG